ncbi:MAG: hypothetical protein PHH01_00930 [Patescibacteria group bacterium]|nr:hypothetical protein [Patescibacteria group bacterium]
MRRGRESGSSLAVLEEPETTTEHGPKSKELCRFNGQADTWRSNENGVIIESNGQLLLNGGENLLPPETKYDEWFLTPEGVVLRQGRDFSIIQNGGRWVDPLYKNEGQYRGHYQFPGGVHIRDGSSYLINGRERVTPSGHQRLEPHPTGVITEEGNILKIRLPENRSYNLYNNFNSETESWRAHPWLEGVVLERTEKGVRKLFLAQEETRNNPQEICEDNFLTWEPCKNGIVGVRDDGLHYYAPGEVHEHLYSGQYDDLKVESRGVVIRVGQEWRLIEIGK